jgi:uncharacterized protein YggU (UPF0235/DUF167 family)
MQTPEGAVTAVPGGVQILVKAVPGASRDRIAGWLGDYLKVAVAAPPEGGRANKAICRLLADSMGVRPKDIQLLAGAGAPRKRFLVEGLSVAQARQRLAKG